MNEKSRLKKIYQLISVIRKYLASTVLMAVFWLLLGYLRSSGVQWPILWPLNFLTGALNGLTGNLLGGTLGRALLLVLFNSMFRGLIVQRGGWKVRMVKMSAELKAQGIQIVLKKIPQYANLKLLLGKRTPQLLGSGLLGIGSALLLYPVLTGDGSLVNSMVCIALFLNIGKQVVKQRGLLISLLNLLLEKKHFHTLNRDVINRIVAGFALGMAAAVPVAALRCLPGSGLLMWDFFVHILPWGMILFGLCGLFWGRLKRRRGQALLMACICGLICSFPVLAVEDGEEQYEVDHILFTVPDTEGRDSRLYGPDVREDGSVYMERGKTYNFTWEGDGGWVYDYMGMDPFFDAGGGYSFTTIFPLNDKGLFGESIQEMEKLSIEFRNVSLKAMGESSGPITEENLVFTGEFQIELHNWIRGTVSLGNPIETEKLQSEYERGEIAESNAAEPEEAIYRLSYKGNSLTYRGDGRHGIALWFGKRKSKDADVTQTVEYQGEVYDLSDYYEKDPELIGFGLVFAYELLDMGYGIYIPDIPDIPEAENETADPIAVTAGAGLFGMAGSVALDFLSEAQHSSPWTKRRRDSEEEEEDSEVSISISKSFMALVNTKGAAVSLKITVSGGEGFVWDYIPLAVCPGSWKAAVPTIVKTGENEAQLILTLSGARMKKPHDTLFITVIAMAHTREGRRLQTSAALEIPLHEKGLEAEWDDSGELSVVSYGDSNLDGIAEIQKLSQEEYSCTEKEDGSFQIIAAAPYTGQCTLRRRIEKVKK